MINSDLVSSLKNLESVSCLLSSRVGLIQDIS